MLTFVALGGIGGAVSMLRSGEAVARADDSKPEDVQPAFAGTATAQELAQQQRARIQEALRRDERRLEAERDQMAIHIQDLLDEDFPGLRVERDGDTFYVIDYRAQTSEGESKPIVLDIHRNDTTNQYEGYLATDMKDWLIGERADLQSGATLDGYPIELGDDIINAVADAKALTDLRIQLTEGKYHMSSATMTYLALSRALEGSVFYNQPETYRW